jgi:ribosome biogenesis GTPase A
MFKEYEIIKKEMKKEKIYCERCFKLSNYTNLEGKNVSKEKANKYINLVKKIDSNKLIDNIFSKIPKDTNVFYIFDIFDMETTIKKELLVNLEKKGSRVVFIANKFDVLPKNTSDNRMKIWVGERLKELCNGVVIIKFSNS